MIRKKGLRVDAFGITYAIIVVDKIEEFTNKYTQFESMATSGAFTYEWVGKDNVRRFGVVLEKNANDMHVVHESIHLASGMLRHLGIRHNEETEEVYAYLASYIKKSLDEYLSNINKKEDGKQGS